MTKLQQLRKRHGARAVRALLAYRVFPSEEKAREEQLDLALKTWSLKLEPRQALLPKHRFKLDTSYDEITAVCPYCGEHNGHLAHATGKIFEGYSKEQRIVAAVSCEWCGPLGYLSTLDHAGVWRLQFGLWPIDVPDEAAPYLIRLARELGRYHHDKDRTVLTPGHWHRAVEATFGQPLTAEQAFQHAVALRERKFLMRVGEPGYLPADAWDPAQKKSPQPTDNVALSLSGWAWLVHEDVEWGEL